jgi:hypothetical protein
MPQLEENLLSQLTRVEHKLEAYRKLHAEEWQELARDVVELRQQIEALSSAPHRTRPPDLAAVRHPAEATDRARWPSLLRG